MSFLIPGGMKIHFTTENGTLASQFSGGHRDEKSQNY
ncbi:MAG: hypothetical protein ACI8RD_013971 [Bacillariaceae sp.]|jgi:hypothetical protein